MNPLLFLSIFSLLGIIFFIVGLCASRNITNNVDYFLAGRNLGFFSVTFTLIATQLGGNMLLGTAQWSYHYGYYGMLYALGMSLGFLLLACGFASKLQQENVATTAELLGKKYNSLSLQKFASFISIVSLLGILVSIVISSKTLINGLGIDNEWIFLTFWVFIIVYTMVGGLHAVVVTDMAQVIFIILCLGTLFAYCMLYQPMGLFSLKNLLLQQVSFPLQNIPSSKLLATFLMPALFSLIEQDLAQRFFAARSQRVAVFSALAAGIFIITFGFIPVYFGMQAQLLNLVIPANGNPFIVIAEQLAGNFGFVLIVCSIIAAITSTADSLLCAISSNVVQDFNLSAGKKYNPLRISQLSTLIIGVLALTASYTIHKTILDIAIGSYELSVSCLLVPLLFSFYKKHLNKKAAFGAVLCGFIGFIGLRLIPVPFSKELITLALSLGGYLVGSSL